MSLTQGRSQGVHAQTNRTRTLGTERVVYLIVDFTYHLRFI